MAVAHHHTKHTTDQMRHAGTPLEKPIKPAASQGHALKALRMHGHTSVHTDVDVWRHLHLRALYRIYLAALRYLATLHWTCRAHCHRERAGRH